MDQLINIDTLYAQYRMRSAILRNHLNETDQGESDRVKSFFSLDKMSRTKSTRDRLILSAKAKIYF